MLTLPNGNVLVAVSGGGDSMALLHKLLQAKAEGRLFAATVDHGLRPEARMEAERVSKWCSDLSIPHETLRWTPTSTNSQSARLARYDLLARHARAIGAKTIALGHTRDDQAETLIMRAMRSKPESGTLGLSGMSKDTSYEELRLWRPLLSMARGEIRDWLHALAVEWIEDPSNENTDRERIAVREFLREANPLVSTNASRLAELAQRDRKWLNQQVAPILKNGTHLADDRTLIFSMPKHISRRILREIFSLLIMTVGGTPYRPAVAKFADCVDHALGRQRLVKTLGRTLVTVDPTKIRFEREQRHRNSGKTAPILPFQRFRPSCDDPVFEALGEILAIARST